MRDSHRRILIWFRKEREATELSHLELMSAMEGAFRDSGLPVRMSEGEVRKVKLTFPTALPQGMTSSREVVEVAVGNGPTLREISERLDAGLPPGLAVVDADWLYTGERIRVRELTYDVRPREGEFPTAIVEEVLGRETIPVERRKREVDLAKLIGRWSTDGGRLAISIRWTDRGTARPEDFLRAAGLDPDGFRVRKTGMTISTTFGETIRRDDASDPGQ